MKWCEVMALTGMLAASCTSRSELSSCRDSLTGVWLNADGESYHLLDHGQTLELFPMFPSPPPPGRSANDGAYSALVYDFSRQGSDELAGQRSQWLTAATGERLRLKLPARIANCGGEQLTLVTAGHAQQLHRR